MSKRNVKVRGVTYEHVAAHSGNALGGKFFGKAIFLLRDPKGGYWEAYGKAVAHNSRLNPADPARWPKQFCLDERHEEPCPLPCAGCKDECTTP